MYDLLNGLRVVEAASFIAAPSCALHMLQMGAEVIRIDQAGGGPDFNRWPLAPGGGASLYLEGLNEGKKSVALDLSRPKAASWPPPSSPRRARMVAYSSPTTPSPASCPTTG